MSYFKIGKADAYKIFTSWDFLTYKSFEIKESTTCKDINDKLTTFFQSFSHSEHPKHISLLLIIRDTKQKTMIFKRKINFFEFLLQTFRQTLSDFGEDAKFKEIIFLSASVKDFYISPGLEEMQMYSNFNNLFNSKYGKSFLI